MSITTERIRQLVAGEHMSRAAFGSLLGLSKASASGKLNERIGWTKDDILVLAAHFGVSADWLLGIEDRDEKHEEVLA